MAKKSDIIDKNTRGEMNDDAKNISWPYVFFIRIYQSFRAGGLRQGKPVSGYQLL
ncbi:MAG: hypothetical protein SPI93_08545 [Oscillospiraceae bacterium]|nr:hypothetical protein [Oscillospiraceae bacterium]